ncbi:amidohydrolase [Leucobacter luti]|uniref:Amidohydrolase 3 domain-containing protein n=1 Tax=Leucobacter luti TaxID=340320 RepID=A0A4R6SA61_9MICO|nr:amidohydrolase [Leucobacter luti]QYM75437.1 amidohydrolase [Leucobacter luti]TDP95735.1 hypothetical protein EDF62_0429 [Leucobacter luti]
MEQIALAFVGGHVFDGSGADPVILDVGVLGDRIVAVGEADVAARTGADTRVIDLTGKLLLPGIIDSHVHPIEGGLERLGCDLSGGWTREDYLETVSAYVAAHPDTEWILGGGWQMAAFPGGFPLAADLDAICSDRPMAISNRDHHSTWVNSEALRRAGITRDTPDPADGTIERDSDGHPTGTLHEGARMLVLRLAPEPTATDMRAALLAAQEYLHAFGITAWQDALIGDYGNHSSQEVHVYRAAFDSGELHARVNGALWWDREGGAEQIAELEAVRAEHQGDDFRLTTVKIMQDGVVENKTAAVSAPYLAPGCACGDASDTGISFIEPAELARIVTAFDARGVQLHFHAIGDRGVAECLDAVAAARAANGDTGPTHHIAHLQVVRPADLPRFAEHRVAANMQPLWASYDPQMVDLNVPLIGAERAGWQYPFRSILEHGGQLVAGSDWPVTTADPWLGMHVAVNRQHPDGHPDRNARVFVPEQRLELGEALRAYTRGGAEINGWDHEQGAIVPGAIADLVIVDRNPFLGPIEEIAATTTVETFSRGRSVYRAAQAS